MVFCCLFCFLVLLGPWYGHMPHKQTPGRPYSQSTYMLLSAHTEQEKKWHGLSLQRGHRLKSWTPSCSAIYKMFLTVWQWCPLWLPEKLSIHTSTSFFCIRVKKKVPWPSLEKETHSTWIIKRRRRILLVEDAELTTLCTPNHPSWCPPLAP